MERSLMSHLGGRNGAECPQAHIIPVDPSVTEADILAYMEPRLSSYKRLTGGVIFTDSIPKSQSGKILRRLIKDPLVDNKELKARL